MSKTKRWSLVVLLLAGGLVVMVWASKRAHRYYYPEVPGDIFADTDFPLTHEFERTGRYEISCDETWGDLTFQLTEKDTGAAVAVHKFNLLMKVFHTVGYRGHGFSVEKPGTYELSVASLPAGAEVFVSYTNTPFIAYWTLAGLILGTLFTGPAFMLGLYSMAQSVASKSAGQQPVESAESTSE